MAGPVIKRGDPFGVQKLPAPVRALIELIAPSDDPLGGLTPGPVAPLVARGGPKAIPRLKKWGETLTQAAKRNGFSSEVTEALDFAQQRYPRLFGHLSSIGRIGEDARPTTLMRTLHHEPKRTSLQINPNPQSHKPNRLPMLLHPELFSEPASVGHELLHTADNVTMPDMAKAYNASLALRPFGYNGSSFEYRAKNAAESFYNKFQKHKRTQRNAERFRSKFLEP